MVMRVFPALAALAVVAGCGGNPFLNDPGGDGGAADTATGSVYGKAMNADLAMNSMVYDDDADVIVVNNIPFDGATAANGQAEYARMGGLPGSSFGRYENTAGAYDYYAVFRRSASGAVEGGAFATARYVGFGTGGAGAKRVSGSVSLPGSGEYTFTGEYAAVRVFDTASGINVPQYVTGDANIEVDFGDFDTVGTILGTIENRNVFDASGASLGVMDDYISLGTGTIDRTKGTVDGGSAQGREIIGGMVNSSGDWSAVFGGANGSEIAGIVVLEGDASDPGGAGAMRETGVIIAIR